MRLRRWLAPLLLVAAASSWAGNQQYEPLAASVQAALHAAIADRAAPEPRFASLEEKIAWLSEMSRRLERRMPDRAARLEFLRTV